VTNAAQVTGWDDFCCRDHLGLNVLGRLKPGVTLQRATETLNALALQMAREDRKDDGLSLRLRRPGLAGDNSDPSKKALLGIMLLAVPPPRSPEARNDEGLRPLDFCAVAFAS
jgi:hypothetical protein